MIEKMNLDESTQQKILKTGISYFENLELETLDIEDREELEKDLIEKFKMLNKDVTPLHCPYCNSEISKELIARFRYLGYNKLKNELGVLTGYAFNGKIICEYCYKSIDSVCVGDSSGYSTFVFASIKDANLCLDKISRIRKSMIKQMGYADYNLIRLMILEQAEKHLKDKFK